jgi:hypothetical protein
LQEFLLWANFYGGYADAVLSGKEFFLCFAMKISGSLCLGA